MCKTWLAAAVCSGCGVAETVTANLNVLRQGLIGCCVWAVLHCPCAAAAALCVIHTQIHADRIFLPLGSYVSVEMYGAAAAAATVAALPAAVAAAVPAKQL